MILSNLDAHKPLVNHKQKLQETTEQVPLLLARIAVKVIIVLHLFNTKFQQTFGWFSSFKWLSKFCLVEFLNEVLTKENVNKFSKFVRGDFEITSEKELLSEKA